jgi:hypothetical protein
MNKKINKEDLWCEYSDMPSPLAYTKPKLKNQKKVGMRRVIQKFTLWLSLKFPKKKRKSIWDL